MDTQTNVRIVVPAYKAETTIVNCIAAIVDSLPSFYTCEIVVVDNSGSDILDDLLNTFSIKVIKRTATESAAYARNEGSAGCSTGILVFIDSDVIVEKDCLTRLIAPIYKHQYNATIGNYSRNVSGLSFAQKYKQLYINYVYNSNKTSIKNDYWTAIAAIDAEVFHDIGGFNNSFKGANGEDQEFGIRLTRAGYNVSAVTNANGQHIKLYTVYKIIWNDYKKGIKAVQNSVKNKVPLSDNRHAGKVAILAVISAVFAIYFLVLALFFPVCLYLSASMFVSWFLFRLKLNTNFMQMGIVFLLQSILLMFILDFTRFLAVISGVTISKFKLEQKKSQPIKTRG